MLNKLLEIFICRRDYANVNLNEPVAADLAEGLFLQNAEQNRLHLHRHIADFIEEKRAVVGYLKFADRAFALCAGERAAFVAEKLAGNKLLGKCRAVDCDKGLVASLAGVMYCLGENVLANTALALNKDVAV